MVFCRSMGRACRVSFTDEQGTQHTAEVTAESLYEAALFGLEAISETWAEQPGVNTPISVSIVPVFHHVTLRQINLGGTRIRIAEGDGATLPPERPPARVGGVSARPLLCVGTARQE